MTKLRILAGLLAVALISACETPAPAPVVYVPPPPPPPPPPLIYLPKDKALAATVFEEAAAFRTMMAQGASIGADFQDGEQVARGLRTGAGFEPRQLQRGAVAFVAVTALGHPDFADGFRPYSIQTADREDMVRKLVERPDYAASFPGADQAAGMAIAALDAVGAKLWVQGRAVSEAAYTVQRQPWGKGEVLGRDVRLEEVKAIAGRRMSPVAAEVEALRRTALSDPPISLIPTPVKGPYTDTVNRGLAIAALAALGEAGEARIATIEALLEDKTALECLTSSKLMFHQCLASADRGHYEDIFCLGRHGMIDPGRCVVGAAGSPTPAFVPPPPPPPPPVVTAQPKARAKAKARAPARRPAAKR